MKFFATIAALAFAAVAKAQLVNCSNGVPTDLINLESLTYLSGLERLRHHHRHPYCPDRDVPPSLASLYIVGKYLGRTVYSDYHDICNLVPCPFPVTSSTITACVLVLSNAPVNVPVI